MTRSKMSTSEQQSKSAVSEKSAGSDHFETAFHVPSGHPETMKRFYRYAILPFG